jgi:VanZ family protein
MVLHRRFAIPFGFFLFISYIIFLADTADYNFAFRMIGHVPYGDKIMHALLYGVMAGLLNWGLGYRRCCRFGAIAIAPYKGSVAVLIFAVIEECTQYYIPSRTFDLWDLAADFVGVILFSLWRVK